MSAGISTSDFADVLTDSIRKLVAVEYDANSDHRRIAAQIEARNFHEINFPLFDLDARLPQILENAEFRNTVSISTSGGESAAVQSFGALVGVSRKVVINDDLQLIETVFRQLAAAAARLEAETVFAVLESNLTLSDGSAMFVSSNSVTGALTQSSLGEAFGKLRRQTGASGSVTNNRPAFLLVPSEQEVNALSVVAGLSNNRAPVEVIATPWVASTNWYLLASPSRSPVIGLLRLAGSNRAVRVERGRASIKTDAVPIKCATDFGATALSRVGAVKGTE